MGHINDDEVGGEQVITDLGQQETNDIVRLCSYIPGFTRPARWVSRPAPSIVVRSEAELFGLSEPRFARRVYLDASRQHFINARPIERLCQLANFVESQPPDTATDGSKPVAPSDFLSDSTCIADCLLPYTEELAHQFYIPDIKMGALYGEVDDRSKCEAGVPYVKHVKLGGGLCGQAVCFMATAFLHRYARGIYGLADVTAIAGAGGNGELRLTGLGVPAISRYLESDWVGLGGACQWLPPEQGFKLSEHVLADVLKAYLLSGMPVVYPVDAIRMSARAGSHLPVPMSTASLLNEQDLSEWEFDASESPCNHAVLIVGFERQGRENRKFLLLCPSTRPFIVGSAFQLKDARTYENSGERLHPCFFLPVTPKQVRLPLLDRFIPGDRQYVGQGLLSLAPVLQQGEYFQDLPSFPATRFPGTLCLTALGEAASVSFLPKAAKKKMQEWLGELGSPAHWVWLQYVEHPKAGHLVSESIWLWDAERDPPDSSVDRATVGAYLVGVLECRKGTWQVIKQQPVPPAEPDPSPENHEPASVHVEVSLLSSFAVKGGISDAVAHWPSRPEPLDCELYCFMPADADALLRPLLPPDRRDANMVIDLMASAQEWPRVASSLANRLHAIFSRRNIPVIGLATFLPEIASPYRALYTKAQDALRFLVDLAGHLKTKGHPMLNIEIVSGSLISGVECRGTLKDPLLVAKQIPSNVAMQDLLKHLEVVAAAAREADLSLSLELEPGPLFILHSWCDLRHAHTQITNSRALCDVLGFNLDKAHWAMARIDPEDILSHGPMRRCVIHCHIADHGPGHLGDVAIGVCNEPSEVYAWVRAINKIAGDADLADESRATRRISIEAEAVSHVDMVALSRRRMKWLTKQLAEARPRLTAWPG